VLRPWKLIPIESCVPQGTLESDPKPTDSGKQSKRGGAGMQRAGHHRGRPQDLSVIVTVRRTVRRTVVSKPVARARSRKGSAGVSPAAVGVPPTAPPLVRSVHPLHPPQYCYGGRVSRPWIKRLAWFARKKARGQRPFNPQSAPPPAPARASAASDWAIYSTATAVAFAGREMMIQPAASSLDSDLAGWHDHDHMNMATKPKTDCRPHK
jgi:hypothetical protein